MVLTFYYGRLAAMGGYELAQNKRQSMVKRARNSVIEWLDYQSHLKGKWKSYQMLSLIAQHPPPPFFSFFFLFFLFFFSFFFFFVARLCGARECDGEQHICRPYALCLGGADSALWLLDRQ